MARATRRRSTKKKRGAKKKTPAKTRTAAKKKTPAKKRAAAKKKTPAKKRTAAKKKTPAKKQAAAKKKAPARKRSDETKGAPEPEPAKAGKAKKRNDKTVPGGASPPKVDDVTRARQILRELRDIVERVGDAEAEQVLGDGTLETLLASVVPPAPKKATAHEHLLAHKGRASLLARLRHGINERSAFAHGDPPRYVAPTRVQWFYDGLTFLEGSEPYRGTVGLYRDGVVRYGLAVEDATRSQTLGPLASDFVSVDEAKRSFRGAGSTTDGLARFQKLEADGVDDPQAWAALLMDCPWMLGAQHSQIAKVPVKDPELPELTGKRATDAYHDVILVEAPSTPLVGKTQKVYASFQEIWARAERLRSVVQRQESYLRRELSIKIRDPRFLILAGRATDEERAIVRSELEMHHAAVRLVTYDELRTLAARTAAFFEPRL